MQPSLERSSYAPRYCVWELTLACNLKCGHCGSRAGRARPDELSTDECLGVVRSLARLGCEVVTLSGGEPTLRRDWGLIAREIREQGMIPNMVTNGVALNDEAITLMREVPLSNVAVSLDGPREIHDRIRGPGTFERSTDAIRRLKQAGVSVTIMTTVNRLNIEHLSELHREVVALKADRWRHQLGKRMGNLNDHDDWVLAPKELLRLLPMLLELHHRGPVPVGIGDSIGYCGPYDGELRAISWKGQPQQWGGCQAGLQAIGIESNGNIKGCLSMQAFQGENDSFVEGNVRQIPLETLWNDPAAFSYNRRFIPESLTGYCRKCGYRGRCRGGARCVAAASTGTLSEDPYCYHRVYAIANRWPGPLVRRHAATAAAMTSLVLSGFSSCEAQTDYGVEPTPSETPIDCSDVCCECDYGQLPQDVLDACCTSDAPDYGVEPTPSPWPVQMEYGVEPEPTPADVEPDYGVLPTPDAETPTPPVQLDYGCEPEPTPTGVDPDYGVLPTPEQVTPTPAVSLPEYGVEPPDITPTPYACNVCCDCDYGQLPSDVIDACCSTPAPSHRSTSSGR